MAADVRDRVLALLAAGVPVHAIGQQGHFVPGGAYAGLAGDLSHRTRIDDYATAGFTEVAKDLWERAGVTQKDIDVAQIYENFTGQTLMSIEDHGFCKRGEGGAFVEGGRLEWPDGELPFNTSGGNLAEAYIHGFELVNEAVRQMRGTSTCQVENAEVGLVASGPGASPFTDMIVRR